MRLLKTEIGEPDHLQLELIEEFGRDIPDYAILSHTWGSDEVTYEQVLDGTAQDHQAYSKVMSAVQQAASDGLAYIWIDSCCINKSSSAELSEALNSMYAWYQKADVCYAFLEDVPESKSEDFEAKFAASRWFTRGWTLQELLAPMHIDFFGANQNGTWTLLGDINRLQDQISKITSVEVEYLSGLKNVHDTSIAKRMSWAAGRETKREEDVAYCLLGLFSINMPMLYGEGPRAFLRLQDEIIKRSDDQSIFAWRELDSKECKSADANLANAKPYWSSTQWSMKHPNCSATTHITEHGLLADSPLTFAHSRGFVPYRIIRRRQTPYQMSNRGLGINLPLIHRGNNLFLALLECHEETGKDDKYLGVYLTKTKTSSNQYARVRCQTLLDNLSPADCSRTELFVRQELANDELDDQVQYVLLRGLCCHGVDYIANQVVHFWALPDGKLEAKEIYLREVESSRPALPCKVLQFSDARQNVAVVSLERRSDGQQLVVFIGVVGRHNLGFGIDLVPCEKQGNMMSASLTQEDLFWPTEAAKLHPVLATISKDGDYISATTQANVKTGRRILTVDFNIWTTASQTTQEVLQNV